MKKFSDKKKREIWQWSEQCYYDALYKTLSEKFDISIPKLHLKELKDAARDYIIDDEHFRAAVDREYRRLLCLLSTEQIRLILAANDNGTIRRAQVTIDSLLSELLERAMNNYQEPSRFNENKNGKSKSKITKRSSSKKKSKTSNPRRPKKTVS